MHLQERHDRSFFYKNTFSSKKIPTMAHYSLTIMRQHGNSLRLQHS
ncbi:hypothetical protein JL2886_01423 [Phaeobacter gallaeciensis]|uniref:Uncharacterized protein n=1 Tax=Phaeobacter gallaeciensis TaxID=60890 RepID=A0A1B0ZQD9_9RHOB|nr:hypothetical protein JL2886_01423 [Phaeobacter gallaeciensis]